MTRPNLTKSKWRSNLMSKSLEWGIIFIFSMAAYTAAMATWFCPFWFLKPIFLGLFILCCIPIVEEIKELRIWK